VAHDQDEYREDIPDVEVQHIEQMMSWLSAASQSQGVEEE